MDEYQFQREVTPRNIILDLMGVSHPRPLSSSHLGMISSTFNVTVNNLRVALTRLVAKGMLDNTERGVYRLSAKAMARNDFARRWKVPQANKKKWDGSWIACHLSKGSNRTVRAKSINALNWFGFKPGLDAIWLRPNNLVMPIPELFENLRNLGLESGAHVFSMANVEASLAKHWHTLWAVEELDKSYASLNEQLQQSFEALQTSPPKTSLLDTFYLGSEAIYCLATDPQLPADIRPSPNYESLRKTMLDYDKIGRKIWLQQISSLGVNV